MYYFILIVFAVLLFVTYVSFGDMLGGKQVSHSENYPNRPTPFSVVLKPDNHMLIFRQVKVSNKYYNIITRYGIAAM